MSAGSSLLIQCRILIERCIHCNVALIASGGHCSAMQNFRLRLKRQCAPVGRFVLERL